MFDPVNDEGRTSGLIGIDLVVVVVVVVMLGSLGVIDGGGEVIAIGLVPSPALYFCDKILEPAASIMITASHNPKDDNGFKLVSRGESFFNQQIQDLLLVPSSKS